MSTCIFCGKKIEPGTGFIFIKNDGKSLDFCSKKCEKNLLKLKRKPIHTKWSKFYQKGL